MATKGGTPARGTASESRLVEVVAGDLFDSDADVIVVPCDVDGGVAPDFKTKLAELRIPLPRSGLEAGSVAAAGLTVKRSKGPVRIMFAAVVTIDRATTPEMVDQAAREVARAAPEASTIAFPLLGTGAGGLDPEAAVRAIVTGFTDGGILTQRAEIRVLDPTVVERYMGVVAGAYPETYSWPLNDEEAAREEESPPEAPSKARKQPSKRASRTREQASTATTKQARTATTKQAGTATTKEAGTASVEQAETATGKGRDESVPTHTDGPAVVDELGRMGFARVLARRIRETRKEEASNASQRKPGARGGAFLIHLHAPWGAGKTSVLNFLADQLREKDDDAKARRSVVVEFNAWRHQRIGPPWWWLMTALYTGAVRELDRIDKRRAVMLRLREWWWRLKGGWPGYVALLAVAAIVVLAWRTGWLGEIQGKGLFSLDTATGFVVTVAAIITPVLTVWGLLRGIGRWVFATSARGARRFVANTTDPMRLVHEHLDELVDWIGYDVVIMIDDLDRCKGPYVVELLEGIQTLFRDVPITYVVAADRDWLADSYAAEYSDFVSATAEVGRPVGFLFLEKTFQVSIGLPSAQIDQFWSRILRSPNVPGEADLNRARAQAAADLGGRSRQAARQEVADNPGSTPAEIQARREVVAVQMVTERAQQENAHTLEPFRALLGRQPNPRMMKRLVNAYGIVRGIETLQGNLTDDPVGEQQTALWTILTLRWPKLGAYLARYPEHVDAIATGTLPAGVPAELQPLFTDPEVKAVVTGEAKDITTRLDSERVRSIPLL
ncbi:KAP-like P-loop domain-containing protein [Kribbella sp. VKM Ac-2527]|uniref:KAP-like P-loop domain-containing protein n=1 Tax=Kribbella caucasensis TaxID=2512215 RepID=A0A4R6KGF6_9ACTN|nr:P-loop NTPase fold protein [Kribbella sp. VKM Ac-2527]TDO47367.1 KAP-like P-loop domain-containing protein [Kribbella sp. VKM Ac-2527]